MRRRSHIKFVQTLILATLMVSVVSAQNEQWLQYRSAAEARQILGDVGYQYRQISSTKPQDVKLPELKSDQPLESFAKKLGQIIIGIVVLIFVIEIFRSGLHIGMILDALMVSVSLAVSAVPEGLPAVVTVSLALGARELAKRNAILRRLSSAETLGAVTVICSDKTGTLTKGEMTVREIQVDGKVVEVTGVGYEPKGEFLVGGRALKPGDELSLDLLLKGSALCSNAIYDDGTIIGDTTEGALIVAAAKHGLIKEDMEKEAPCP